MNDVENLSTSKTSNDFGLFSEYEIPDTIIPKFHDIPFYTSQNPVFIEEAEINFEEKEQNSFQEKDQLETGSPGSEPLVVEELVSKQTEIDEKEISEIDSINIEHVDNYESLHIIPNEVRVKLGENDIFGIPDLTNNKIGEFENKINSLHTYALNKGEELTRVRNELNETGLLDSNGEAFVSELKEGDYYLDPVQEKIANYPPVLPTAYKAVNKNNKYLIGLAPFFLILALVAFMLPFLKVFALVGGLVVAVRGKTKHNNMEFLFGVITVILSLMPG